MTLSPILVPPSAWVSCRGHSTARAVPGGTYIERRSNLRPLSSRFRPSCAGRSSRARSACALGSPRVHGGLRQKNSYNTIRDGRAHGGHSGACSMSDSGGSSKRRQRCSSDKSDGGRRSGRSSVGAGCAERSDGAVELVDGHVTCSRNGLSTCRCPREVAAEL